MLKTYSIPPYEIFRFLKTGRFSPHFLVKQHGNQVINEVQTMRTVVVYLFWAIPILLLIALAGALMEEMWHITLNSYVVYTLIIVALIALHYFKFHRGR